MKLSVITPCSRPLYLPRVYQSLLDLNFREIEWIIVYDSNTIDDRILQYEKDIQIKQYCVKSEEGDSTAARQRNLGIENSSGDYIYYLDDDNIIYSKLLEKIGHYFDTNKLIFFNQLSNRHKSYRIKDFNGKHIRGVIDTAQILVPKKFKHIKWELKGYYMDEVPYIKSLLKESNNEYIWINRGYSYYNFLRRFD